MKSKKKLLLILTVMAAIMLTVPTFAKPKLNRKRATIQAGKTVKLKVKGAKNKKIRWSSSNKAVVTIKSKKSNTAVLKGVGTGKVTVKAKVGKKILKCRVVVVDPSKDTDTGSSNPNESAINNDSSQLVTPEVVAYVREIVDRVVTSDMTPDEKLWAIFDYIGNRNVYPYLQTRIPYYNGLDWPLVYLGDMMNVGGSDSHGTAALFGYAASMIGYDSHDIHWVNNGFHAWVDIDGLIYDPIYTNSSYHTVVFGYTYPQAQAAALEAGYEQKAEGFDGTYRYIRVPEIR